MKKKKSKKKITMSQLPKANRVVFICIILLCIFFAVIDFFNLPSEIITSKSLEKDNIVYLSVINKNIFYFLFAILFAIQIYWNQNEFSKKTSKELNIKIEQLEAIKQPRQSIIDTTLEWINDSNTEIILFYFPFSILPGFWTDYSRFFTENFLPTLASLADKNKISIIIIGPGTQDTNNFMKIIDKIKKSKSSSVFINTNDRMNYINFNNENKINNLEDICNHLVYSYKNNLSSLETKVEERKNFITLKTVDENYWKGKPSFSFIYRKLYEKNKTSTTYKPDSDFLILDTFNIINDLKNSIFHFNNKDLLENDRIEENILKDPSFYLIKHSKISNLLISTIIQTSFYEDDEIFEKLTKNKKKR